MDKELYNEQYNRHFVNMTPHAIRVRMDRKDRRAIPLDTDIVIPPCGTMARLVPTRKESGRIASVIPLSSISLSEVEGLPEYEEGMMVDYIVSMPVGQVVCSQRPDVIVPDTQPDSDCVRDEKGQVYAVTGFVRFV